MSLLMEALRKAEEAKRRMQLEEQAAARKDSGATTGASQAVSAAENPVSSFTLEQREPDVTPAYIRDNFARLRNQAAADDLANEPAIDAADAVEPTYVPPPPPPPAARTLARQGQRAAAASVFAAKQNPARKRNTLTVLVIAMLLMMPIGGGVLWYLGTATSSIAVNPNIANYDLSSRTLGGNDTAPVSANDAAGANPAPVATPPVQAADVSESPAESNADNVASEITDSETDADAVATVPGTQVATETAATANAIPPASPANAGAQMANGPVLPEGGARSVLEISRSRGSSEVDPELVTAYNRLQSGDLPAAGQLYQDILRARPNNRDALLGLALVNLRQGALVSARELYARLLQLNPRDALAHTGLLQTMQAADPVEHESALKRLIGEYPGVAQLTLALGNLYAAQQRWSEAQGAYYNALLVARRSTDGPVHPDYAFNLAVSLEQLGQPRAALEYYRQAQELAAELTPGFDPQLLSSRLAYLSTQAQP